MLRVRRSVFHPKLSDVLQVGHSNKPGHLNRVEEIGMDHTLMVMIRRTSSGLTDDCGHELVKEATSPEAKYIAAVFDSTCGATTPFSRQVLLRKAEGTFSGDNGEDVVFRVKGKRNIEVRWVDAEHLMIRRSPNTDDIVKEIGAWHRIKITYVADWPTFSFP
ncbi:MAG: hypothetical protein MRJ68_20175 [Nitrospira sp.]|nr:hypothetical protein [Nitrospira sp.]